MAGLDHYTPARDQAAAVRAGEISARELLELHLARIDEVNPRVNALVNVDAERARAAAAAADERQARGEALGPLHGLPFAVKDTHHLAGWPTTFGSPTMAEHVSTHDELHVARVLAAGAIPVAKSNVPEFAAGSHTFNPLFGTTLNPWDLSRSAGGSSGGAAAALASGMVALADGSDMGGSLRNPASFNNVVGLRPGFGRVPIWPYWNVFETVNVFGPLARDVEDLALLLSVMAGPDDRVVTSSQVPGATFAPPLQGSLHGLRVALSTDLGGAFEVDAAVAAIISAQGGVLADAGALVTDAHPDLDLAEDTFKTLRAWLFHHTLGDLNAANPGVMKPSLVANIEAGAPLTGADVARGHAQRTVLGERMRVFFQSHDVLAMPVSQVPPFPADQEYPSDINGREQATYLDWMRSAFLITATGCPAISVPAGFTDSGLPVGLQLVGPAGSERRLLEIAHAFEQHTRVGERRPAL
jgi:amidase